MGSERQSGRRDFPVSFRGYDRAAVDAHVEALVAEIERLRADLVRGEAPAGVPESAPPTVAEATGEQVQGIIAAAEQAAAEIARDATRTARERVGTVGNAADSLLSSVEAMEGEIDGLLAQLRAASARIHGELGRAAAGIDQLHDSLPAANGAVQGELEPPRAAPAQAATPELPAPSGLAAPPAQPAVAAPSAQPAVAAPAPSGAEASEIDHARLVAVNMALSGEPRGHTERRLRDELGIADPAALVDDVYAALEP